MKCPRCEKELQPNWQVCPSCGTKIAMVRICSKCKREIEEGSISCPHCGLVISDTGGSSASIKDSVIKEIHQTQNIYNESRPLGTPEYQYEKYVLAVLESGGKLERARTQLEQRREQLGLSLKQSKEVEDHCLALNKKAAPPLKLEETNIHEAKGANVGGSIYINVTRDVNESRPLTSTEKQYEQFFIMLLQSGENLEYAKVELGQLREQLGLSLKRTNAIEVDCLTEVNAATIEEVDKNGLNKGDITMKACTKCGKLVSDQAKFCDNCGASLSSNVESFTTRSQATQTPSSNIKRKIKQLCPFCQGTGLQPGATFTNQKCPTCKGYRYNLIEEGSPQCAICHGSGRVKAQGMVLMGPNFVRCPACGGTGADQDF